MKKKAEPLHKVSLELTDSELRELASKKVKRWTDIFLPTGLFVGLLTFLLTSSAFGEKPTDFECVLMGLSAFAPMVLGFVINYYSRIKLVKDKVEEWKGNKG
jgi:hypothetical protein